MKPGRMRAPRSARRPFGAFLAVSWAYRNWRAGLLAVHIGLIVLAAAVAWLGWAMRDFGVVGSVLLILGSVSALALLLRLPWTLHLIRSVPRSGAQRGVGWPTIADGPHGKRVHRDQRRSA